MKFLLPILTILIANCLNAQDSSYAEREYDKAIFLYQLKHVKDRNINKESYLENSKPFSKWDSRPLNHSLVWIMNELQPASTVPNFFWGSFSKFYGESVEDAMALPITFSKNAYEKESAFRKYFKRNQSKFKELIKLLAKSSQLIFVNQVSLKRVDDLFLENDTYWKYVIAEDSPFPMSDSIGNISSKEFTRTENTVLNKINDLNIYAIYNGANAIYFLIDGLLDNSYGFVYQKEPGRLKSNALFNIKYKKKIETNYYYYISN